MKLKKIIKNSILNNEIKKKKFLKKKEKLESTESIHPNQDPCHENVTIQ